ncbi:MAG: glycerol-3-phosphate acyltransferase [Oscillospiraceae bacterium]|nr:glycerol-3-phosphate acyltransferase [Oscillospiraceae bacterium]
MEALKYLLIVAGGYLLGSVSISIILSRMLGTDVRKKGSGNAGATNMARSYGLLAGFATLAGDFLKAAIVMYVGWRLCGDWGLMAGGMACTTGHCFPIFYDFRGGKGISVGAAIGLAIDWRVFIGIVIVFLIAAFLSKKASLGSVCAAVAVVVFSVVLAALGLIALPRLLLAIYAAALAVFQHRSNLKRLSEGTEPDFKAADVK